MVLLAATFDEVNMLWAGYEAFLVGASVIAGFAAAAPRGLWRGGDGAAGRRRA